MRIFTVIPGEVEVEADGWEVQEGALQFFGDDDLLIAMWAPGYWHRVQVSAGNQPVDVA